MTQATETAEKPATEEPAAPPQPWEEVLPEHFQMLRLAPLPTDRATGGRPLRFVQFGRAERHSRELSLLRLNIQLPGQRVRREQNHLDVWADHQLRVVRFGPESGLQVEPWNRGLGRFLIAHAIHWAQKRWSTYRLEGVELASKDGLNPDTRNRRDHFLRTQGFEVVYEDTQHMKGSIKAVQVGNLQNTWNNDKVQIVEVIDAAHMLEKAEQNLAAQEAEIRKHEQRVNKYKRDDSSLRFTIACLVTFAVFQAGLLIWIATHR
ncbi:hypothetical protein [Pseudomonas ovata]|uniref:hypothetical protein n=1 Tax=Pseudomonas ovata TaxID=1839709 RepID=UPI000D69EEF8|nr:hypothetical protein [Pseudomonas ovata]